MMIATSMHSHRLKHTHTHKDAYKRLLTFINSLMNEKSPKKHATHLHQATSQSVS